MLPTFVDILGIIFLFHRLYILNLNIEGLITVWKAYIMYKVIPLLMLCRIEKNCFLFSMSKTRRWILAGSWRDKDAEYNAL